MSKLEVEMTIDGEPVAFHQAPVGGITWEYVAGYYDASGTITQNMKDEKYLETRVFVWSGEEEVLEHLRAFLARAPHHIEASIEDVKKRKYPRWRLRIGRRKGVVTFARILLQHLRVQEKRDALLKAMEKLQIYTET